MSNTPELFDPITNAPAFDFALRERDRAMEVVEENAEEVFPGFKELAAVEILRRLATGEATGEDLTDHCRKLGIVPHNDRAFGPVMMRLMRSGKIIKAGYGPRRKGHGAPGATLWKLA